MNMKNMRPLLALALLLPVAAAAQIPASPSYNYAEIGYTRFSTDPRIDGYTFNGSFALGDRFHLFGGFSDLDARRRLREEDGVVDTIRPDVGLWNLGLGYQHSLSDTMDLVARAAYQRVRLSNVGPLGGSDDSWSAEVGVRSMFSPRIEGYAFAGWQGVGFDGLDIDEWSGDFYGRLGGLWYFTPRWGLNLDLKFADGNRQWFVGPRLNF
jgi:Ax21 family sulfation-dependent quorum factor